jgi:3-dehydroquinate synthase
MTLFTVSVALDGDRHYDILIGSGLLAQAGERLKALGGNSVAIVTDSNVADHHLDTVVQSCKAAGLNGHSIVVPAGEKSKSFAHLEQLCADLLEARIERGDLIVALGGGVIGDLTGFAAAILRRGVRCVQMPTSLLAQVDSSVGGKTGINTAFGKNLIGAFHQPSLVLADTDSLDTLPSREFRAGYAEVAKYGLINDTAFFAWLEHNHGAVFAGGEERRQAVRTSCAAKAAIVMRDEKESGERALLNLGHTFGHALEASVWYDGGRLVHGEGVAIGICLAFRFSAALGLCAAGDAERVERHFKAVGLPTRIQDIPGEVSSPEQLLVLMAQDKKVTQGQFNFILAHGIGQSFIARDVAVSKVEEFLQQELQEAV